MAFLAFTAPTTPAPIPIKPITPAIIRATVPDTAAGVCTTETVLHARTSEVIIFPSSPKRMYSL